VFEWDEAKSRKNLRERGFDFAFAARIFDQDVLEHEDTRHHYGERRIVALREIEGEVFVVVYTWRGTYRRIISARRANRRERDAYCQTYSQRDS
jgi:uncharacterized DUF497 family protein